ncbi:MAG: hypothetical protein GX181_03655 [Synergistaceae bacterium]|nr:hypothetical protein [Synergistaceae bacterium]
MVNKSERSQMISKLAERLIETMMEEAVSRLPKEQALLDLITSRTSEGQQKEPSSSFNAGREQPHEQATGGDSSEDTKRDWVMEMLLEMHPDHTEEEIKEAAYGLLG